MVEKPDAVRTRAEFLPKTTQGGNGIEDHQAGQAEVLHGMFRAVDVL